MVLFLRKNLGLISIFILLLVPIVRWFLIAPLDLRFFDLNTTMTSLGQLAGLVGITLFSVNLILSSRLKFLDRFFYGLDRVYNHHRTIGAIAFSLLLFHPLFLVVKYIQISLRSAALFFIPVGNQPGVNFGIIALFLMIVLMGITFYLSLKYQNWKLTHKFMVAVFIFAILHVISVTSDVSRDSFLRFYILGLSFLGLAGGFYRAFLSGFINRDFKYRVKRVSALSNEVTEVELEPTGRVIEFKPGQFVFVRFSGESVSSESHPFSISSAPGGNNLKLTIKSLGDFTGTLKNLKAEDPVLVAGPFGKFSYENVSSKDQIWIAGGIGITPFLSMARNLGNSDRKIDLYYCVDNQKEAVLSDELATIAARNGNFNLIPWYSTEKGYINGQRISDLSGGFTSKDILLCGPVGFMQALKKQLLKLNVARRRIHFEQFNFR